MVYKVVGGLAGGAVGLYSQDLSENPLSTIAATGIGATTGYIVANNLREELERSIKKGPNLSTGIFSDISFDARTEFNKEQEINKLRGRISRIENVYYTGDADKLLTNKRLFNKAKKKSLLLDITRQGNWFDAKNPFMDNPTSNGDLRHNLKHYSMVNRRVQALNPIEVAQARYFSWKTQADIPEHPSTLSTRTFTNKVEYRKHLRTTSKNFDTLILEAQHIRDKQSKGLASTEENRRYRGIIKNELPSLHKDLLWADLYGRARENKKSQINILENNLAKASGAKLELEKHLGFFAKELGLDMPRTLTRDAIFELKGSIEESIRLQTAADTKAMFRKYKAVRSGLVAEAVDPEKIGKSVITELRPGDNHERALKAAFIKAGDTEADAERKAKNVSSFTKGKNLKIIDNKFLEVNGMSVPITQKIRGKEGVIRTFGQDSIDPRNLRNFNNNPKVMPIVRGINPFAETAVDAGGWKEARAMYDPEELFGLFQKQKGEALSIDEIKRIRELGMSITQYSSSSSIEAMLVESNRIDLSESFRQTSDGKWKLAATNIDAVNLLADRITRETGESAFKGVSKNSTRVVSAGLYQSFSANPLPSAEHGEGLTLLREDRPLNENPFGEMFKTRGDAYKAVTATSTYQVKITDDLADLISREYGSKFAIGEGQAIFEESLAKTQRAKTFHIGYIPNKDKQSYEFHTAFKDSKGNNLLTESFFKLSAEEKINVLKQHNLDTFKPGEVIGLSKDMEELRTKDYYSRTEVLDIKQTREGIKVFTRQVSEPKDWAKFFGVNAKAGAALFNKTEMKALTVLALLEADGLLQVKDKKVFVNGEEAKSLDSVAKKYGKAYQDRISNIGSITSWDEAGANEIQRFISGSMDDPEYMSKVKEFTSQYDSKLYKAEIKTLTDTTDTSDAARLNRANTARALQLVSGDFRGREEILDTVDQWFMSNNRSTEVGTMTRLLNESRATKSITPITALLNEVYSNKAANAMNLITVTPQSDKGILGSGGIPRASHLQRVNMIQSGMDKETIEAMYRYDTGALQEARMLASYKTDARALNSIITNQQDAIDLFDLDPDDRRDVLKNKMNIDLQDDIVSMSISENSKGYKSIPISLIETGYSRQNHFGVDMPTPSQLEKARKSVLMEDLKIKEGRGSQSAFEEAISNLHGLNEKLLKNNTLQKSMLRMEARYGSALTAAVAGGKLQDVLDKQAVPTVAISRQTMQKFQSQLEGTDWEITTQRSLKGEKGKAPIAEGLILRNKKTGSIDNLMSIYTREPAQGPHSVMPLNIMVSNEIKDDAGNFYMSAKGEKFLPILSKLDADADTPAFTLAIGLNDKQRKNLKRTRDRLYNSATEPLGAKKATVIDLIERLNTKNQVKDAKVTKTFAEISDLAYWESQSKLKGTERKIIAPTITRINAQINNSLNLANIDDNIRLGARAVAYNVTESLLKTSHLGTDRFAIREQFDKNIQQVISDYQTYGDQERFKKQFRKQVDTLFNVQSFDKKKDKAILGAYDDIMNVTTDAYARALSTGDAESVMLPTRRPPTKNASDMANLVFGILSDKNIGVQGSNKIQLVKDGASNVAESIGMTAKKIASYAPEVSAAVKNTYARTKKPLGFGLSALAGIAIFNAAEPTEIPAHSMPQQQGAKNAKILEPRMDSKFHTRKIREDQQADASSYIAKVRGSVSDDFNRDQARRMLIGDDQVVRSDININNSL